MKSTYYSFFPETVRGFTDMAQAVFVDVGWKELNIETVICFVILLSKTATAALDRHEFGLRLVKFQVPNVPFSAVDSDEDVEFQTSVRTSCNALSCEENDALGSRKESKEGSPERQVTSPGKWLWGRCPFIYSLTQERPFCEEKRAELTFPVSTIPGQYVSLDLVIQPNVHAG